jgi:HAD superfamily hydrolase (TIGR01549 family)
VVFLDTAYVAAAARAAGYAVADDMAAAAEAPAKRAYEAAIAAGESHERGWFVLMESLLAHAGVAPESCKLLAQILRESHDQLNLWRRVPPDLADALDRARAAGMKVGIVSNSEGRLHEVIEHVGLRDRFEVIVDSGIEGVSKPDPEIFRRALERLGGIAPADALYAGDIPSVDVDGARAAGLRAVLVDPFGFYPEYRDAPVVASVAELVGGLLSGRT